MRVARAMGAELGWDERGSRWSSSASGPKQRSRASRRGSVKLTPWTRCRSSAAGCWDRDRRPTRQRRRLGKRRPATAWRCSRRPRGHVGRARSGLELPGAATPRPESEPGSPRRWRRSWRARPRRLPERQREVLALRELLRLSYEQIAQVMDVEQCCGRPPCSPGPGCACASNAGAARFPPPRLPGWRACAAPARPSTGLGAAVRRGRRMAAGSPGRMPSLRDHACGDAGSVGLLPGLAAQSGHRRTWTPSPTHECAGAQPADERGDAGTRRCGRG